MEMSEFFKFEQEPEIQPQSTQELPSQQKNTSSQHLPSYLNILKINSMEHHQRHKESVYDALKKSGLEFDSFIGTGLKLKLIEFTKNYEYLLLNVSYNSFIFHISLLNINDQSPIHKVGNCHSGNFSSVYNILYKRKNIAIKCNRYSNKSFQLIFRNTLLEYLSFQMITKLKSGPKMLKVFGFDLLIYRDCIEFSMEFCRHQLKAGPILENDLKLALRNLHSLKMIHFDIKPDNICFSEEYERYVFIDLGLHRVINEEIGQITFSNFQGSLLYCSKEMRQCFLTGARMLDLYYNDALCLEGSLKEINQKSQNENLPHKEAKQYVQTNVLIAVKMKFILTRISEFKGDDQYLKQHFYDKIKEFNVLELKDLYTFIANLSYSLKLERITNEIINYSDENNKTLMKPKFCKFQEKFQLQSFQQIFQKKGQIIMKLNKEENNLLALSLHKDNLKDCIQFLINAQKVRQFDINIYYRCFAQMMQINCWKIDIDVKDKLCNTFNQAYLSIDKFEELPILKKKQICFQKICDYISIQTVLDDCLYEIIKRSLLSAILLQVYGEEQLLSFITGIMGLQCPLQTLIRIFVYAISCIQWILHLLNPIYCYCYLMKKVCEAMLQKLSKNTQVKDNQCQMLIKFVMTIIQPEGKKMRKSYLKQLLTYLQEKKNCKVMKFYNAVSKQEQFYAQIYVYLLRLITEGSCYISIIELDSFQKLLSLQKYKQQYQICTLQYYQMIMISQFMQQEQMSQKYKEFKKYFNGLKIFIQAQLLQSLQRREKFHLILKLIDYSKYSKLNALIYQNYFFSHYVNLIGLIYHNTKNLNLSLDDASLRANLNLKVVEAAVVQVRKLSYYQVGNYHLVIPCFVNICSVLTSYQYLISKRKYVFDEEEDQILEILKLMKLIVKELSCVQCKINCHIKFFAFCKYILSHTQAKKAQLQLFNLALWLIKQPQINSTIVLYIFQKLCDHSRQFIYEKLMMYYIISNKISLTYYFRFVFQQQIEVDRQKNMVALFWRERYSETQVGKPYYFVFINAFYRELIIDKYDKNHNILHLTAFIQKFMILQGYLEFFNFHQEYLNEHIKELNKQWELALYFGSILLPLYNRQQQVEKQYYCYVWRHYHKFSLMSKQIISTCIYRSFLCNEIMHKELLSSPRRHRYLLKLDYKNRSGESEQNRLFLKNISSQLHQFRRKVGQSDLKFKLIKLALDKYYNLYCIQLINKRKKRLWRNRIGMEKLI